MDPVLGSLIISVLALVAREIRWHRVHGRTEGELKQAREQATQLVESLRPTASRKMPQWGDVAD